MNKQLLRDIEQFLSSTGMGAYRFGILSVKNGRLVERIRSGGRVWPETELQIRAFMSAPGGKQSTSERAA